VSRTAGRRLAAALLSLAAACPRDVVPSPTLARRPSAAQVTVFVTAGLRGSLEPCGCSANQRGGIDRIAFQLERARSDGKATLLFDGGDTLFGATALPEEARPQQRLKARALAEALRLMRLLGTAPGPLDDALGETFRKALTLPELGDAQDFTVEGVRIAVLSTGDAAALAGLTRAARGRGARFVLAFLPVPFDQALRLAVSEAAGVDLLVATRPQSALAAEAALLAGGRAKVVQVPSQGRAVLKVDLSLRPVPSSEDAGFEWVHAGTERDRELLALSERVEQLGAQIDAPGLGGELKALKQGKLAEIIARREALAQAPIALPEDRSAGVLRLVSIEATLPRSPAVRGVITAYDLEVGRQNLEWATLHGEACPRPTPQNPPFLGSESCRGCHPNAFPLWEASKHRQAWKSLEAQGKHNHLDCVACHVNGWKRPGGVCRLDKIDGRQEVGCEACHGPGLPHLVKPVKATVTRPTGPEACVACHDHENSPRFDYQRYVEQLRGPGHGLPMPDAGVSPSG
jgi:hypothetical protein